jgi:hypothetical protein
MNDHSRRTGPAVEAHFQFLMWLIPTVEKFPRSQKFTLAQAGIHRRSRSIPGVYTVPAWIPATAHVR